MTCNGVIVKSIGYNIKISGNIHKILIVDLVFETPGAINQYTVKDKMNLIPLYRGSEMYRDLQPLEVLSFSLLLENYIFLMNIPGYHKKNKTILRLYFLLNILCNDEFLSISAIRDIQQNHIKIKELLKDITTIVNKDINLFRFLYIHINSTNKSVQSHYFIKFTNTNNLAKNLDLLKSIVYDSNNTVGPKSIGKQELIKEFNKVL